MSRIYSGCRRGLVWLGEEDDETEAAFRLIQFWSQGGHYSDWEPLQKDLSAVGQLAERP
jgi:hypothetical protein